MEIYVDLLPKQKGFFISVGSGREVISFDYTTKGHRIIKQGLVGHVKAKKRSLSRPKLVWQTLKLSNGKPWGIEDVKWFDRGKFDISNDEIWKTLWAKPMPARIRLRMQEFSSEIYRNRGDMRSVAPMLKEFDVYVSKVIKRYEESDRKQRSSKEKK